MKEKRKKWKKGKTKEEDLCPQSTFLLLGKGGAQAQDVGAAEVRRGECIPRDSAGISAE